VLNVDAANPCPTRPGQSRGLNTVRKRLENAAGEMSGLTGLTAKADKEDKTDIKADTLDFEGTDSRHSEKYDPDKEDIVLEFFTYARGDYYYRS